MSILEEKDETNFESISHSEKIGLNKFYCSMSQKLLHNSQFSKKKKSYGLGSGVWNMTSVCVVVTSCISTLWEVVAGKSQGLTWLSVTTAGTNPGAVLVWEGVTLHNLVTSLWWTLFRQKAQIGLSVHRAATECILQGMLYIQELDNETS